MASPSGPCLAWGTLTNVTIEGAGAINGRGNDVVSSGFWQQCRAPADPSNPWHQPYCTDCTGNNQRPSLLLLMHVDGLTVQDLTLHSSAFWTLHPAFCSRVRVRRVTILASLEWWEQGGITPPVGNADGVDLTSCVDSVVEDSFIRSGDDCIGFYALDGWAGREYGTPLDGVVIRNVSCGTPMSACWIAGGARNITVNRVTD
jgi:polygalacturonase